MMPWPRHKPGPCGLSHLWYTNKAKEKEIMATFHGKYVKLDYGDIEFNEDLENALFILDASCRFGSGGTYDINEADDEQFLYEAVPCDGPFDTLYFDGSDWTEGFDEDEEEEDEDEDEGIVEGSP
jgi:hypothetical protein